MIFLSHAPRTSGNIPTRPFSISFRDLPTIFSGKIDKHEFDEMEATKNPVLDQMGFRMVSIGVRVGRYLNPCSKCFQVCLRRALSPHSLLRDMLWPA